MRWLVVLLAVGCVEADGAWLSQLGEIRIDGVPARTLDQLTLRSDARLLVAAEVENIGGDYAIVSSDPAVLDVAPLDEDALLWSSLGEDSALPPSTDQAIVQFADEDESGIAVELVSGEPGTAELSVVDLADDRVLDTMTVDVGAPAEVRWHVRNPVGWDVLAGAGPVHVLAGTDYRLVGTQYDREGRELVASLADEPDGTDDRVWVQPEDIVALDLRPARNRDEDAGLLLVGIDREGRDVYGIPATFSHAETAGTTGDFYLYAEAPHGPEVEVSATWEDLDVAATVRTEYPGKVSTSDVAGLGCAITGPAPVRMLWALAVIALAARRGRTGVSGARSLLSVSAQRQ